MPYIDQQARTQIGEDRRQPENAGELNFLISCHVLNYLDTKGERYQTYNDIMGVLAGVQQEIYRRLVAPYEDKKILENGDIL